MYLHMEKCMHIVSDLVGFCHFKGAEDINISISHNKENRASSITISCPIPNLPPETVTRLCEDLNVHRQHEVEQDYWQLNGASEMSGELTLTGMMIDRAEIRYDSGVLFILIARED